MTSLSTITRTILFALAALCAVPAGASAGAVASTCESTDASAHTAKRSKKSQSKKKRNKGPKTTRIEHVVRPGETLGGIAAKYQVSVKALKRWNRMRKDTIYVDRKLVVHTANAPRPTREVVHTVKRGETLGKIAKVHDCTVAQLRGWNKIRNPRSLRVGQSLRIIEDGPEKDSKAVGRPNRGKLVNGEQMPKQSSWYTLVRERNAWGTNETITQLQKALRKINTSKALKKKRKRIPPLVIGDLSRKGGGRLKPHKSHQTGRDVDLGYYHHGDVPSRFRTATKKNLDYELTWALIDAFIEADAVDYIFIDRKLQRWIVDWALENNKAKKSELKRIFGCLPSKTPAIIRHEPGHKNHMHVRFRCPSSDESCT